MADEEAKRKKSFKSILMVFGLLVGEAAVIVCAMMFLGRDPDVSSANSALPNDEQTESEKIVELQVLDGKLPNAKTGVTYLYNTEIYVQVKNKNSERVTNELGQFSNEIKADIGAIWRTSDPRHFQEPKLENLTRKIYALLHERFGVDSDDGEPVLVKCVIVMGTGFRIDS